MSEQGRVKRRRPASLYEVGEEPDPRFTMANERTFLAWIRTALAFVATGIALVTLRELTDTTWATPLAAATVVVGAVVAPWSYVKWRDTELALRLRRPLPAPTMSLVLILGVVALGAMTAVVIVQRV